MPIYYEVDEIYQSFFTLSLRAQAFYTVPCLVKKPALRTSEGGGLDSAITAVIELTRPQSS